MATERPTVAVIGLGPAGLAALKNLLEEGFDATGFDRNPHVGGLWQYTEEDKTSVLESTVVNISKERGCFSDFPYPEDLPSHPLAADVCKYMVSYAEHFQLQPHLRLSTSVGKITFDDDRQQWAVELENKEAQHFDKVVLAIGGMISSPNIPVVEGLEKFRGESMHSRAFKKPAHFAGKRVMVVGFQNTAADTATQLADIAEKVYIAHRNGARILPRRVNGKPVDHSMSLRLFTIQSWILSNFPVAGANLFDKFVKGLQDKSFKLRPEWGFEPDQIIPIISDDLVDCLERGTIQSVKGISRIISDTSVELNDGTVVDVDVLIWCTGYKSDFSILEARFDPTSRAPSAWSRARGSNGKPLARLYQNVFSLEKPESLAILGNVHFTISALQIVDLTAMAFAQVWKGASKLPSQSAMERAVEEHHAWLAEQAGRRTSISPAMVNGGSWLRIMDDLAGTGVNEQLGYGWKGWWFWLSNRKMCNLLMGGVWSPHIHRYLDGKRKKWDGAGDAIKRANGIGVAAVDKDV